MDEKRLLGENTSPETKNGLSTTNGCGRIYEIQVQGHLSVIWTDWFEGLTIERLDNGEMVLSGFIIDQAALMGVLNKIHRLNLSLLCLKEIDRNEQHDRHQLHPQLQPSSHALIDKNY